MLLGGRREHAARTELDDRQPWPELEQPPCHLQRLALADRDAGLLGVADRDGPPAGTRYAMGQPVGSPTQGV